MSLFPTFQPMSFTAPSHGRCSLAWPLLFGTLLAINTKLASSQWHAGWGFQSHRGLPAMPSRMQSRYLINQSIVGYFVANNSGLASVAELVAESKLGVVGIGWNLNHLATSSGGGLEAYEIQQAAALKQARPDLGVMVLRNTEVVSTFWTAFREAMNDTDLWLQSPPGSGKIISEPWGTDDPRSGGPTPKYFLNYSNPRTQQWWLQQYVAPALEQADIDGVYTDCSCGNPRGHRPTPQELVGRQRAFDAALAMAQSKGKWLSAWAGPAVTAAPTSASDCVAVMNRAIEIGANESHTLQLQGGWAKPQMEVSQNAVAAFLIARGASAVIVLPPYDRPMLKAPFSIEGVDANADPGTPLGPAKVSGSSVFSRSYTKADIALDCAAFKSTITFK